jgi:glycosyltransferase involved in cell wall biosynthesis
LKVLVAHPGTQYSYHLVRELEKHNLLYRFYTCFTVPSESTSGWLIKLLPAFLKKKISNRILTGVPPSKVRNFPFLELSALRKIKRGEDREIVFFNRNKQFQEQIPDRSIAECDVVIGYDTSSWILADRCRALNKKFILDTSIPHPKTKYKVYQQILKDYPDWGFALQQKRKELIDLEEKEMELAEQIVVASTFSKKSLIENGIQEDKISVIPYGVDSETFRPLSERKNGPVRFVFVGLVDSRKGVPLLLDAWSKVRRSGEPLTIIGPVTDAIRKKIHQSDPAIQVLGRLSLEEIKKNLPSFDVMIFPSYFEGFGLVILEALACGLPVITTEATCAPDVVEQNSDGFIFRSGNLDELRNHIQNFLNNGEKMKQYSKAARSKALHYSWANYGDQWTNILKEL